MNYSVTYGGAIVGLLVFLAKFFNLDLGEEEIQGAVENILSVVSFAMVVYGRFRIGGVNIFGLKK